MKLFGSTKKFIDKTKNGEKEPSLKVVEVVLVQCNLVDNQYQQKSEILYTFTLSKYYAYMSNGEPSTLVFLKTYNTEFDDIIITFTDQNGRPLEIEHKVNFTLLIGQKNMSRTEKYVKGYGLLSFARKQLLDTGLDASKKISP